MASRRQSASGDPQRTDADEDPERDRDDGDERVDEARHARGGLVADELREADQTERTGDEQPECWQKAHQRRGRRREPFDEHRQRCDNEAADEPAESRAEQRLPQELTAPRGV